jgi:hypothetical protein
MKEKTSWTKMEMMLEENIEKEGKVKECIMDWPFI